MKGFFFVKETIQPSFILVAFSGRPGLMMLLSSAAVSLFLRMYQIVDLGSSKVFANSLMFVDFFFFQLNDGLLHFY